MIWKNYFKKLAGNAFIQFAMFCNVKRKSAPLSSMIPLKGKYEETKTHILTVFLFPIVSKQATSTGSNA